MSVKYSLTSRIRHHSAEKNTNVNHPLAMDTLTLSPMIRYSTNMPPFPGGSTHLESHGQRFSTTRRKHLTPSHLGILKQGRFIMLR